MLVLFVIEPLLMRLGIHATGKRSDPARALRGLSYAHDPYGAEPDHYLWHHCGCPWLS